MSEFWKAYRSLRKLCSRDEEVALGAEVSVFTVRAWDLTAERSTDKKHRRNPSYFNRVRLARFAESKGAPQEVVDGLSPEKPGEARA